ncbi:unannotated protein [freshwater metagenome]|uniref:Unannotated protein n=1 Tax=freshwater metagenome TaxID=449393 RepID=A0A6J7BPI5_9ZZZZ
MGVLIEVDDLDRVSPFGVICDESLTIVRAGPSWRRLTADMVGRSLFDVFDVIRPAGIDSIDSLRLRRESLLLFKLRPGGPRVRFQIIDVTEPVGVMLLGAPVVSSSEELDQLGLSAADFSPIDQTPDLLLLRRGQERSLIDLRSLNSELQESASDLRTANRLLTRAEAQYRRLVELQPLVMYVDRLGANATAEFISSSVEGWLGYPVVRWLDESSTFFFDIVHPDDREQVWAAHLRCEREDSRFDEEFRLTAADGRIVWTRAVDSVVSDDDGSLRRIGFMIDITKAKTSELELRDTMSRLTVLLAHMQSGVLVEDSKRRVVIANDTLCAIFGSEARPGDLIGLPASAAVHHLVSADADPVAFLHRTDELIARRWPAVNQTLHLADSRVLEFDFQPIVDEGHEAGALWMFRDATDRVQYQAALGRARDEAIAASDAKSKFLASMSHEIRTPMHGVLATVELLQMSSLDPDQRELLEIVGTSASTLVAIINDILDLQRVESGRIELSVEPFSVVEVLEGVQGLLAAQAIGKGLEFAVVLDPGLPSLLIGDPLRLRQVLINLAGNAVKFTVEGGVTLAARLVQSASASALIDFEVRDSGPGIPEVKKAAVFESFVQGGSGVEGTGLGLAISQRLVGLMGGRIDVSSVVGEGSSFGFRIRLPLAGPDSQDVPAQSETGSDLSGSPNAERRLVLVVDDSAASRNLVMRQLARLDSAAMAVGSGGEALALLEQGLPIGLVLLDVEMPDLDGPATTEIVRRSSDPRVASVPIFGLTTGRDDEELARCQASGMDGQLSKPVDISELRRLVNEMMGVTAS